MRPEPLQPACLGNSYPYDVLIDEKHGPTRLYALREARQICGRCIIRDTCHAINADEEWVKALNEEIKWRTCEQCGASFEQPARGPRKRYCTTTCRAAHSYAKRKAAA